MQRQGRADAQLDGALVEHRQGARQSQADGASVRIRPIAEARRAGAERLGQGLQLHVDFKADDRLVPSHDFGRDPREAFLCLLSHLSRLVYHPQSAPASSARSLHESPFFDLSLGSVADQGTGGTRSRDIFPGPVFNKSGDCRTPVPSGCPASVLINLGLRCFERRQASPREGLSMRRLLAPTIFVFLFVLFVIPASSFAQVAISVAIGPPALPV